jgi:hypothetical protein
MAEHIHQQRIGAHARVQLSPISTLSTRQDGFRSGVDLIKTSSPLGIGLQRFVADGMEISVQSLATSLEAHDRGVSTSQTKRERPRQCVVAGSIRQFELQVCNCAHAGFFSAQRLSTTRAMYSATRMASWTAERNAGVSLKSRSFGATIAAAATRIALERSSMGEYYSEEKANIKAS